jgi:hypothetical protein
MADELVQPVPKLRAVIVQRAAHRGDADGRDDLLEAAVFLLQAGCFAGPERLSTLGVRAVKEQTSVGSSLFAQPLMLQAVALAERGSDAAVDAANSPEARAGEVLQLLGTKAGSAATDALDVAMLSDHLSLLRRWYYRPEKQRAGEIFFPYADGGWPVRRILRGAARMALGEPAAMAETDRVAAGKITARIKSGAKVKVLHEGRPDVERVVPVYEPPTGESPAGDS